jgi:hypothetical protein
MTSWSTRYRASFSPKRDTADSADTVAPNGPTVRRVNSVTHERTADEAAERAAIQAEPPLPPPGTPERERLDLGQLATVAGLLAAARWTENIKLNRGGPDDQKTER